MRQLTLQQRVYPYLMSQIHIEGVDTLQMMWSPRHIVPVTSKEAILNPNHPRHELLKRSWETCTYPLWFSFLTTKQVSMKRVVRSWLNNRTREAFVNALKRKGYDRNGYRINTDGEETPKANLIGSLHCLTREGLITTKWPDLEDQADRIVAEIERRQSSPSTSEHGRD